MCLILFAYKAHPNYPLILAANRDEFYARPTQRAHWWEEYPGIFAGKDLKAGGTWMGIHRSGRIAALTNYRDLSLPQKDGPSRGELVTNFLLDDGGTERYLASVQNVGHLYNGFNLLVGNADDLWWYSNEAEHIKKIQPGIHGLSNHLLNTSWPKVDKGKVGLEDIISKQEIVSAEPLFSLLRDQEIAADAALPDTGISIEMERMLSAMFISSESYGTRVSTVLMVDKNGLFTFEERAFYPVDAPIRAEFQSPNKAKL